MCENASMTVNKRQMASYGPVRRINPQLPYLSGKAKDTNAMAFVLQNTFIKIYKNLESWKKILQAQKRLKNKTLTRKNKSNKKGTIRRRRKVGSSTNGEKEMNFRNKGTCTIKAYGWMKPT